jgi:hypothetical protein
MRLLSHDPIQNGRSEQLRIPTKVSTTNRRISLTVSNSRKYRYIRQDTSSALIIKVDIEGAEASLFRSNTEWVCLTDLIAIELHDYLLPKQQTSAPFIRSFANLDFDLLQRRENLFVFLDRPAA